MRTVLRAAAIAAALSPLALPAGAAGATKTTAAGPPLKAPPPGVPEYVDATQFFPKTTSVHVGDSVRWRFYGFHSIYFPKQGGRVAPLFAADPSRTYADSDPAGAPFWFNGRPQMIANPAAAFPVGGRTVTGARATGSGIPQSERFTYRVRFPKAGSFTYLCTVHPKMKGTVRVRPRRVAVPSAAADARAVDRQIARTIAEVKRNDRRAAPAGNVVEAGRDTKDSSLFAFYPAKKAVPVGGTVDFRMSPSTNEVHTITFGNAQVLGKGGYAEKLGEALFSPLPGTGQNGPPVLNMPGPVFHPSDPERAFDPARHGSFFNSGLLGFSPLPRRTAVTFTKAGSYRYICLIHPDMKGEIDVQ